MDEAVTAITLIASVVAVIGSISAVVVAWRKAPHENRKLQAEAESAISEAAVSLIEPLQKRIDDLEKGREKDKDTIIALETRVTALECELREERNEKADIVDGAHKLYHQVQSLGAQPLYQPPARKKT